MCDLVSGEDMIVAYRSILTLHFCFVCVLGEGVRCCPIPIPVSARYGPLARYEKLWAAHALGMPGTLSPPPRVSDPDMHHGTCATHVSWCMPWSLTSCFIWSRWRGKGSRHSPRMRIPQFYVSGERAMAWRFVGWFGDMVKSWSTSIESTNKLSWKCRHFRFSDILFV